MKICEVVTERGRGADGAYELKKRRTDPMSPQNVLKRSQQAKQQPRKPKFKDYTTRAPQNYNMAITSNDPTGAMGRA
tara:strand:+ start:2147 stop:2377 length:231 start_codon:yes stop_codon:yes gene_type:complete